MSTRVTKSEEETVQTPENNIDANQEKCHQSGHLMLPDGEHAQEITDLIAALRKIGYFKSFRVTDTHLLSSDKTQKTLERKLKRRKEAAYRRVKKYYKSVRQCQKESLRRKLCWLLSGKYKQSEIAEMLGMSVRTVIRDLNRIKPYYFRLTRAYLSKLEQERIKEFHAKLEGKNLFQRFQLLSKGIEKQRELWQTREYRRHYQIILLDLTQLDSYGIPKVSFFPKGSQTLAYPYKVRVKVKGCYEGREFTAEIGGFNIVQKTRSWL